jgi:hypothetical protein
MRTSGGGWFQSDPTNPGEHAQSGRCKRFSTSTENSQAMYANRERGKMMKSILIAILFFASGECLAEVPDSIVGTWHFDTVRTMSNHIDQLAKARPDLLTPETASTQKAALEGLHTQSGRQLTLTITENTILNEAAPGFNATYRVIGGNSRLVIVDGKNDAGFTWVGHIRLVEGGIAFETIDCITYPEQCAYGTKQAIEQMRQHTGAKEKKNDEGDVAVELRASGETSVIDGLVGAEDAQTYSQPKWVYFKRAEK